MLLLTFQRVFSILLQSSVVAAAVVVVRVSPGSSSQDTVAYKNLLRYFPYFGIRRLVGRLEKMILVSIHLAMFDLNLDETSTI